MQVEDGEITASISVDETITFTDSTLQFSKADVDTALLQAQEQAKLLQGIERALNTSKEYLHKVCTQCYVKESVDIYQ